MIRLLFPALAIVAAVFLFTAQALAGPHFLPRLRLPKINLGKAAKAVAYPVTKSVGNGAQAVVKAAVTAETAKASANMVNPKSGGELNKLVWGVGRH